MKDAVDAAEEAAVAAVVERFAAAAGAVVRSAEVVRSGFARVE